jgi:protein-tyrosine phosphatase
MGDYFYPAKRIGKTGVEDASGEKGGELWIGSARDAADVQWLSERKIGLVVNCTRNLPFAKLCGVKFVRVAVDDHPSDNDAMFAALPEATLEIARALENGVNVLVHCHAGMQRSATVSAAALYRMRVGPMRDVIERMMKIKPEIFPRSYGGKPTFTEALRAWVSACRARGNPM